MDKTWTWKPITNSYKIIIIIIIFHQCGLSALLSICRSIFLFSFLSHISRRQCISMVKTQGETLLTCIAHEKHVLEKIVYKQAIRCFQPRSISLFIEFCVFFYTSGLQGHPKTCSIAFLWQDTILICSSVCSEL